MLEDIPVPPTAIKDACYKYEGTVPPGTNVLSLGRSYISRVALRIHPLLCLTP